MKSESHIKLLISIQRALLGNITSNIRSVICGLDRNKIYLKFLTFEKPSETDEEFLSIVGTEILADFPEMDIVEKIEQSSKPIKDLLEKEYSEFIFLRAEE